MRKIELGALVAIMALASTAMAQTTLSHSINNTAIANLNSVACFNQAGGFHVDNSYWRSYTLAAFGITTNMEITSVSFGIETCADPSGSQPVNVRIYSDSTPATIGLPSSLFLLGSETFMVTNTGGAGSRVETVTFTQPITVLATDTIVVELNTPTGVAGPTVFFIGSNTLGQTAPSYLSAAGCGINQPTDTTLITANVMHIILDLTLDFATQVAAFPGTGEDLIMLSRINNTPFVTGIGNDIRQAAALDFLTVRCESPNNGFTFAPVILAAQLFATGFPPAGSFPGIAVSVAGGFALVGGGASPIGFLLLPPSGFELTVQVPAVLGSAGVSVLFQYVTPLQSAANGIFASTDGHEFQIN